MKKRSKFSLSNYKLASMKMGYIVPINLTEVLPGDSIQQSTGIFMRLAPMVAPVMHPVHMTVHHFYVPTRIIWDDFEDFITGGPDGTDTTAPPTLSVTPAAGTLADYFGLPLGNALTVSALPFRAYDLIWNEYYRDQDLMSEVVLSTDSGADTTTSTALLKPCWAKDYFTTARPWPQKGPNITLPIGISAPVVATGKSATLFNMSNNLSFALTVSSSSPGSGPINQITAAGGQPSQAALSFGLDGADYQGLKADLSGVTGVDINALRQAFALQRFQEKRALFGSRYEDYLRFIGVRPQDARLQLPEYLGGGSQTIQFSEVLQTGGDNVGALYGHGISAMRTNRFRRFIPEHGYIMSFLIVRPIPVYTQGIERLWSRQTKDDYWQKEFEHIGQQEVLNKEVYADGSAADENTFGYQNRYDEYRRGVNTVSGEFRTNQDYWHMARIFANRPALNADFVQSNPTDRIFQANEQNSDQLYVMAQNNIVARRLVSKNGNPI
uniref:Major capsid protein n=1 Tax=Dulem virus 91 TaxID=3145802 RepID=A0AAU8B6S7_9VIRU